MMSGARVRHRAIHFQHLSIDEGYIMPKCLVIYWWPRTKDNNTNLIMVLELFREESLFKAFQAPR